MTRRGSNSFKRNDVIRAITSAKKGGLEPSMLEVIIATDGSVIYRVYGEDAAPSRGAEPAAVSAEWQAEIEKLKATPKGAR
jgi:hypothetical protein